MPKKSRGKSSRRIIEAARALRQQQTPMEKKLWDALRNRRLARLKFRRQHPCGRFILDVFCVEHQLEIEVDGEVHKDAAQAAYDVERTEFLKLQDIRVLRFTNTEIEHNLKDVLRRISMKRRGGDSRHPNGSPLSCSEHH